MSYRSRRSRSRSRERYRSCSRSRERNSNPSRFRNGRPPNIEGMVSLKVDNLSYRITPEDLLPIFERYGEVGDIYAPRDRFTKEFRGFAFVRFYHKRDAEDAVDKMDGYVLDGREMRVQMARYCRPAEPPHVRYGRAYSTMGRKKKGQLQAAPDYNSGGSKLARLYQQQEQQEQQRHEEQPKQQQERQEQQQQQQERQEQQQQQQERQEQQQQQQERQEQQQHQNGQEQSGWGQHCLFVAAFILVIILLAAMAFLVVESLLTANQRAEECSLRQRLDEEIQGRRDDRQLLLKKDNELQILVEEKRQLQRANEDLNGRIHKCNDEKKQLERVISKCDREKQQMRSKESDITGIISSVSFLGVILVIGGGGVVLCGILGGKR